MDGKILIMDYSEFEREKLKYIIGNMGSFEFIEVESLNKFVHIQKDLTNLALIVMDIAFPVEKEGLDIIARFRKNPRTSQTPIIITTRSDNAAFKSAASKYSVNDYIVKPYTPKRLENSVQTMIKVEKKFVYRVNRSADITMSFEDFILKELKIADRMNQPLSLILITSIPSSTKETEKISRDMREKLYSIAIESAKISLRVTDTAVLNNQKDILIVLPGSDASGAKVVSEKIKANVSERLKEINILYENYFYSVSVTFPDEGKDFQSLMESAFKKISDKEMLEQISSILVSTRQYADKIYRKFNK